MNKTLFLLLSLALLWGCVDDPFENHSLQLETEVGLTEAWLSLHVEGLKSDAVYTLQRDDTILFNNRLDVADTVIYDSLLTPATSYRYRFFATERGETSPALVTVLTTLDTTGHDFDWQSFEFGGQKGSSDFYDVAIIDENDIWAVGEIYTADTYTYDSLGNWIDPYNAAHWDGEKWTLKRILFEFEGQQLFGKINSVFAFNKDDVWFGMGSVIHWNGERYQSIKIPDTIFPSLANKIWGTSSSDLYIVGNDGLMAHYDGTRWRKIRSGTDLPIIDIWGVKEPGKNKYKILAIASRLFSADPAALFEISGNRAEELETEGLPYSLTSVWSMNGRKWYLCGDGFYQNDLRGSYWKKIENIPPILKESIRGDRFNNYFLVGHLGLLVHWNGLSWKDVSLNSNTYQAVATKDDLVVATGHTLNGIVVGAAHILMGRRR